MCHNEPPRGGALGTGDLNRTGVSSAVSLNDHRTRRSPSTRITGTVRPAGTLCRPRRARDPRSGRTPVASMTCVIRTGRGPAGRGHADCRPRVTDALATAGAGRHADANGRAAAAWHVNGRRVADQRHLPAARSDTATAAHRLRFGYFFFVTAGEE